jgi:hypothetical protein
MSKYDDFDYHVGDAVAKGQPEDNAFTHIGFMLAWLIGRGLGKSKFFGPKIERQITDGTLRPNDLRDLVDGQLLTQTLKPEAVAFLDAYYHAGYPPDYEAAFPNLPEYGVPDDPEHQAVIDRLIDDSYGRWVAAGRPKPGSPGAVWARPFLTAPTPTGNPLTDLAQSWIAAGKAMPRSSADFQADPDFMARLAAIKPEDLNLVFEYSSPSSPEEIAAKLGLPEGIKIVRVERQESHVDQDLELVVATAIGVPLNLESLPASKWGAATLNRALRNLGVKGRDVVLVTGMGTPKGNPVVQVQSLPGVERDRLVPEFQQYHENLARGKWKDGLVGNLPARWGTAPIAEPWILVWFAVDGYVASIASGSDRETVEQMAKRLLGALRR